MITTRPSRHAELPFIRSFILASLLFSSCRTGRTPPAVPGDFPVPDTYATATAPGTVSTNAWWEMFQDPQLNHLVARARAGNLSLAQAAARVRQSRALAVQAGSSRFPSLTLDASAASSRTEGSGTGSGQTVETYTLGPAASYELDAWGRVGSTHEAARLTAQAAEADHNTLAISVTAETALRYFEWLREQQTLDLLRQQLAGDRSTLDLVELRFRRSTSTALDVFQQREVVAETESLLAPIEASAGNLADALSLLTGSPPDGTLSLVTTNLPPLPPLPESGLPAGLLETRPDIQASWWRLVSAEHSLTAARADRLPAIRLSASGLFQADALDLLLDTWILKLAASFSAPLLDGGRRRAEVDRQRAISDERIAAYRVTVYTAIQEVQETLRRDSAQVRVLNSLREEINLSRASSEQALQRYLKGQENYLRVLSARRRQYVLERQWIQACYQQLAIRVQLARALGGYPATPHINRIPPIATSTIRKEP